MAPLSYDLADYLSWTDTDALASQQVAWARIKTFQTIDFTWGSLYSAVNGSTASGFGSNGQPTQV